jgi:hypothetical protein
LDLNLGDQVGRLRFKKLSTATLTDPLSFVRLYLGARSTFVGVTEYRPYPKSYDARDTDLSSILGRCNFIYTAPPHKAHKASL